jgi:hypothetical protein
MSSKKIKRNRKIGARGQFLYSDLIPMRDDAFLMAKVALLNTGRRGRVVAAVVTKGDPLLDSVIDFADPPDGDDGRFELKVGNGLLNATVPVDAGTTFVNELPCMNGGSASDIAVQRGEWVAFSFTLIESDS